MAKKPGGKRDSVDGLGAKLIAAREAAGLTRAAAGELTGVGRANLWQYETERKTPSIALLYRFAAAYRVSPCDLLPPAGRHAVAAGLPGVVEAQRQQGR